MEENSPVPSLPAPSGSTAHNTPSGQKSNTAMIFVIIAVVVIIGLLIFGAVLLIRSSTDTTARVRDVFIIFMALESLVIGAALIILIVQLATLINLLQNEVKPILHTTSETVNTLRGTVTFISDNLTEPVITLNSYLAGLKHFFDLVRPVRPKR